MAYVDTKFVQQPAGNDWKPREPVVAIEPESRTQPRRRQDPRFPPFVGIPPWKGARQRVVNPFLYCTMFLLPRDKSLQHEFEHGPLFISFKGSLPDSE